MLTAQLLLLLCPRMAHRSPKEHNADEGVMTVECLKRHFTVKAVETNRGDFTAAFITSSDLLTSS
jgi:hypothetical protein